MQGFSLALRDELAGTGVRLHVLNPASVATNWWELTGDPQPSTVLERMLTPEDVANTLIWILGQPDRVQIDEVIISNAHNPWQS